LTCQPEICGLVKEAFLGEDVFACVARHEHKLGGANLETQHSNYINCKTFCLLNEKRAKIERKKLYKLFRSIF
jgi:hypothetical protein